LPHFPFERNWRSGEFRSIDAIAALLAIKSLQANHVKVTALQEYHQ